MQKSREIGEEKANKKDIYQITIFPHLFPRLFLVLVVCYLTSLRLGTIDSFTKIAMIGGKCHWLSVLILGFQDKIYHPVFFCSNAMPS